VTENLKFSTFACILQVVTENWLTFVSSYCSWFVEKFYLKQTLPVHIRI